MVAIDPFKNLFRAAPVIGEQIFVTAEKPAIPDSYRLTDLGGFWLAADGQLPVIAVRDSAGRQIGFVVGHVFSEFDGEFLKQAEVAIPVEVSTITDVELLILPRLSGMFVFITCGSLPPRLYMDHGATFPMVYSPEDRRAATSVALLLEEQGYRDRFRADLHAALVGQESTGAWISGTLTAHRGVFRVLANHYLDLATWTTHRFWPRPGEFSEWRDFEASVGIVSKAITEFSAAASRALRVAVTLTAGSDTRGLVASCRTCLERVEFFTIEADDMDEEVSRRIAKRFGLTHRTLPVRSVSEEEVAVWDRMVSDCMIEETRRSYTTLADLTERDFVFTGLFGETGRCRLYRQDYMTINDAVIDVRFIADRLTLPRHPELLENMAVWLAGLEGQPNSVIMEMAFVELKVGVWAMGKRPAGNQIKLNLQPFCQRRVLEAFVGVAPAEKGTHALFHAVIVRLWPELMEFPINKFGDLRDQIELFKKLFYPGKIRRYLRDRLAKKAVRIN